MAYEVEMPKFGETMTEGTISKWFKQEGEEVVEGEAIFEVNTDKASLEVEAPASGVLAKILVAEEESAPINEVVAVIAKEGEEIDYQAKAEESNESVSEGEATKESIAGDIDYDICVIGGGPGGYVAAIKAAQLGAKVALVEGDELGGTCLNRGCIPTKAYLKHSELLHELERSAEFGIEIDGYSINWPQMRERKNSVVQKLTQGVGGLLKKKGVDLFKGYGELLADNRVKITGADNEELRARKVIIATGSKPFVPGIPGVDLPGVITSKEALDLEELPESILIIGGGVIGVEMATVFASLDVEVTIVELMEEILPGIDKEVVQILRKNLAKQGINILTDSEVEEINSNNAKLKVQIKTAEGVKPVEVAKVLVAVGRKPNLRGLDELDLEMDNGHLVVDSYLRTSQPDIYAIGDVIGEPLLAHVASAEGIVAAENAVGKEKQMDYTAVPGCIYTIPELASVGLSEAEAVKQGYQVEVGKFPFMASGKALAAGYQEGLVKIVADKEWDQVLGVQIIGPHATELIAEATLAVKMEVTTEILAETIHAHPTLAETIMEAAHDLSGGAIHI
ncbi:dihydrolipoyl dehydrogenase [Fuchsiella alkaliacetigena]|uniref:dihydrolipoyl dehydrogenase n=1 Tax=Fuchsiella alkaliacetigena TaxID=957042 RepID=UPI00200A8346|nr:dihydrolipoyl dehydrogenase [Fuchsiella alkaliacetigena]MCK8824209.1 dihydrolipoyl dehydrogenase [Fuchsiella alkaliacetigena]